MSYSRLLGPVGLLLLMSAAACGAPSDEADSDEASVTSLQSYWADAKKLDLSDLTRVTVSLATDELNNQLAAGPASAKFEAPSVFAAHAEPNALLPDGSEIKSLDAVVSGLASSFGEHELGTEVNKTRLDHLSSGADKYYVESAFQLHGGFSKGWSMQANGLMDGAGVSLGFDAGADVVSRVILATGDDHIGDLVSAPLAAAKSMRGFVYPRTVADIKKMKPGEMFALRGLGKLGGNFGLGAPLLVAEPTGGLAYRIVASAGVSGVIGGQLDVQLVRLDGDEVVVDVGVENGKGVSFSAAIRDGWGVKGICDDGQRCLRTVDLGPAHVDLAKLVEKAVETRLNSYLTFKIEGSASKASSRVSVSRFRFHLNQGDPSEVEAAIQQTLKFDVRLAQALYNRDLDQASPAVVAEFDAVRAATTTTRSFGFELMGMNIYHNAVVKKQGEFVVQTPDGARSILFDAIDKHGGWFQMDHGFTRIGVAAQTLDARHPDKFSSEANLFLQTAVGDSHMDNDLISDNVDAMLLGLVGKEGIDALDQYGNAMQQMVWSKCPVQEDQERHTKTWDEQCNVKLLDDPDMKALHAQGIAAFEPFAKDLPTDYADVARKAAATRLTLQSVGIHNLDAMNGPNASFTLDLRFDDKALSILTSKSKDEYRAALREYITAVYADRMRVGKDMTKDDVRKQVDDKWGGGMDKMAARFDKAAKAYKLIADAERLIPTTLAGKRFVSYPLGLRFTVDRNDAKMYASAVMLSTSHDRAMAAAKLFDDLEDEAGKTHAALYDEQTAAFPLLQLVPISNLEVGMAVKADVKSTFWVKRERYLKAGFGPVAARAKGADVSTISAGMFDLDAILNGN